MAHRKTISRSPLPIQHIADAIPTPDCRAIIFRCTVMYCFFSYVCASNHFSDSVGA